MQTKLTLVLAGAPWAPQGDPDDRLVLHVRLDGQGRIDGEAFDADPADWVATRHRPGEAPRNGRLVRAGRGWALMDRRDDDAPAHELDAGILRPGELADLCQPDGARLAFRVVAAEVDEPGAPDPGPGVAAPGAPS